MSIGFWQIILIVVVILLLFGAGRITRVMGELGKGMRSFKKGLNDDEKPRKRLPPKNKNKKS